MVHVRVPRKLVRATIAAKTARPLKFKLASKHAKTYTLATASRKLKRPGKATLTLKLSAKRARALKRVTSLELTLTAVSSAANHSPRTATKTITLR